MNEPGETKNARGPGKRLQEARLKAKLSTEQVAEQLHLSPRQITALENDDFEQLPGPTYVRGYLRSYSQLLGLPSGEIIDSYGKANGGTRAAPLGSLVPEREVTTRDPPVKFATFLVLGILVLLALVWWQGRSEHPAPGVLPSADQGAGMTAAQPPAENALAETGPPSLPAQPDKAASPESSPGAATGSSVTDNSSTSNPEQQEASAGARLGPSGDSVGAAANDSMARLLLSTREECWVDVRDAHDNKLLYALVPAGRNITLVGAPPLAVFLGNPDGVALEFNGESLDPGRFKRGLVARFTLPLPKPGAN